MLREIEHYFKDLSGSLTGEKDGWKNCNLEIEGPILVLEPGIDDLSELAKYGLNWDFARVGKGLRRSSSEVIFPSRSTWYFPQFVVNRN